MSSTGLLRDLIFKLRRTEIAITAAGDDLYSMTNPPGLRDKLAYSMGGVANNYMGNILPSLALPIFSVGLGVEAWKVGLALAIPRIWDAITDPIIGHLSDSSTSRWGRRRPFILAGALASCATYALLWVPSPSWDENAIFWWFLVTSFLYYTATTIFAIPYIALGYEIATDSLQRAKLMTFRSVVGSIFALGMPWIYAMCFWNWQALAGEGSWASRLASLVVRRDGSVLEAPGYQIVGIAVAVFIGLTGLCAFLCKENPMAVATQRNRFFHSFGLALRNRPFLFLTGTLIFTMFGIFLVMPMATYVNIYHIFGGDQPKAATVLAQVGTAQALAGIALVPIAGYLIARFGAAQLMKFFLIVTALSFAIKYWTYTPENPWLQVIPLIMWAFSWAGVMLAFNVMLGDVCDLDDLQTGERREGIYGAINQFFTKLMIALSTALSGVLLSWSGIVAGAAQQTPEAVWWLRIEFSILPFLIALLGAAAFYFYPLNDQKADEVRANLRIKKGQNP